MGGSPSDSAASSIDIDVDPCAALVAGVLQCGSGKAAQLLFGAVQQPHDVASLAGLNASVTGGSVYTASKHALVGMTRAVAKEYAPYGVRANAVCPGFVSTPLAEQVLGNKFDAVRASQPMARVCEAHEVAELVYWLSSEAASFVTGVAVPIDGGFRA